MAATEKRDVKPVVLKFGVAVALSLGGILYSILRTKKIKPSQSLPPPPSDCGNGIYTAGGKVLAQNGPISTPELQQDQSCLHKASPDESGSIGSPSSINSSEKDGFLLPEFNELVENFDLPATKAIFSLKKDTGSPRSEPETPREFTSDDMECKDHEIKKLRNMVRALRERERNLEIELLEYYGLKEQETAFMELQNRLKINNVEAKFFNLKIESLQTENKRLKAQVADHAKVVRDLDAARAKIKLLKRKFTLEVERNREQILSLKERVQKLQNEEHEVVTTDQEIQLKLQSLKELEAEAQELRQSNQSLQSQNSDLAQKIEFTEMLAESALEDEKAEALKAERSRLRRKNKELMKEIEQLKTDRSSDVEELVYLRWINACLRHELREYQPEHGKISARDLNTTLSPKSEEKAKQLIIEYANKEGFSESLLHVTDSDFDRWSSTYSNMTDSGEFDDTSVDNSSSKTATTSKKKFLSKLKKLVNGKDNHHRRRSLSPDTSVSAEGMSEHSSHSSMGNLENTYVTDPGTGGLEKRMRSASLDSYIPSRDPELNVDVVKDPRNRRISDVGPSSVYRSMELGRDSPRENHLHGGNGDTATRKSDLVKYAQVLKESSSGRSKPPRPVSHCSF